MNEEIPVEYVKELLARMIATTSPDDKPGQAMIRKYKRLLAEELRARRNAKRSGK